jgi:hypothetical protein
MPLLKCYSLSCLLLAFISAGCASHYATPGRGANLTEVVADAPAALSRGDPSIVSAMGTRPLAKFPTGVAVVRIQAPGYVSETAEGWGRGRYSIVTTRDIEAPADLERLSKLPMVSGIGPINRLLLPSHLESDLQLREAAARMHADVLMVYTLDTTFVVEDKAAPLSVVTLGLSPNQQAKVLCTASALLLDTRNGYLYGVAEATDRQDQMTSAWTSGAAVDQARRRTETKAFAKLVGELEKTWAGVVGTYAGAQ